MKRFFCVLTVLSLSACADLCGTEVIETTQLYNQTNQELDIELCKVPFQQLTGEPNDNTATVSQIEVFKVAKTQEGTFLVDSYPLSLKKDSNNKCPTALPASYNSQIFLTAKSYSQVRLCRDNTDPVKASIVSLTTTCPTGTTRQPQAITNCNDTSLVGD